MRTLLLIFALAMTCFAQNYELGGIGDLKGKTAVFLSPEIDFEDQGRITKIVEKANVGLKIVSSLSEADIVLTFGGSTSMVTTGASATSTQNTSNVNLVTVPLEEGSGIVLVKGEEKLRLVLKVSNSQQSRMEKRPVTKFAEAFVKAYRSANGLEKK